MGYFGHDIQKSVVDVLPRDVLEMLVVPDMKQRKEKEERKTLKSIRRSKGLQASLRAMVPLHLRFAPIPLLLARSTTLLISKS